MSVSLENPGKESWLCGEDFTLADICLCILLHRLKYFGYSGGMFENGLLPNVDEFYGRVQKRKSFQDVCVRATSLRMMMRFAVGKYLPYIGIGGLVLVGVGVGYYLYTKKK